MPFSEKTQIHRSSFSPTSSFISFQPFQEVVGLHQVQQALDHYFKVAMDLDVPMFGITPLKFNLDTKNDAFKNVSPA